MSGSNIKYKGRKGNKKDKKNYDNNHISLINIYLLYCNRSNLPPII